MFNKKDFTKMKFQGIKKLSDDESPSKRVRWTSSQQDQITDSIISSIQLTQNTPLNQNLPQQDHQKTFTDINKDLIQNKSRLMNLLIDNEIQFSKNNPNQYQATIKLINNQKHSDQLQNQSKSISSFKVSSNQGYYSEKTKQNSSMAHISKQNKQPFISAVINDIKAKGQQVDLQNTFNFGIITDPSVDQNERFLHFLEEKYSILQKDLSNAEQLFQIHNTNQNIKQMRDCHANAVNIHKKLCAIYLRCPTEFRLKAIQYLRPIQSTIMHGNYTNLKKDSDLEVLYVLLSKLLLDNCDAQTMEDFVEEQIKLQACELYSSSTSAGSNKVENLNHSQTSLKQFSKKLDLQYILSDNGLSNSITIGQQKSNKSNTKDSQKLIIHSETPQFSQFKISHPKGIYNGYPSSRRSFSNKRQDLNTSHTSKKDDTNKSFNSKSDKNHKTKSYKKRDSAHQKQLNISQLSPCSKNNNSNIFSFNEQNAKTQISTPKNKNKESDGKFKNLLTQNNLSIISSSLQDSAQYGTISTNNNSKVQHINTKQKQKFSLSSGFKQKNNLKINNIYGKTYNNSISLLSSSINSNYILTDQPFSQLTTNKRGSHFDISQNVQQQIKRSHSNKNSKQQQSVLNSFISSRTNTEETPKSIQGLERRNSRSITPSKFKKQQYDQNDFNNPSPRKLMKASEMQREYDNSKSSTPKYRKSATLTENVKNVISKDFQKQYEKILRENFSILKQKYSRNKIIGQINEKIIQDEFSKSLKILNQNFHLLSSEDLMSYYDFIQNKAQDLYKQFMKKNKFW